MEESYLTKDLLSITGMTRDTLRHYEQKGLIQPEKDHYNNYRQFRFTDIYRLLTIDFYRKHGFTINELKGLQDNFDDADFSNLMQQKRSELEEKLQHYSDTLDRINKLDSFHQRLIDQGDEIVLTRMPLYEVVGTFSEFASFEEYHRILEHCSKEQDILSSLIRCFEFDETGLTHSRMLIVKEVTNNRLQEGKEYLNSAQCISAFVTDNLTDEGDDKTPQRMFEKTISWAQEKNLRPLGQAFVQTKMITYHGQKEQAVLEVFIPVK